MNSEQNKLSGIADRIWKSFIKHHPGTAAAYGVRDYLDRMEEASLESEQARTAETEGFIKELDQVDVNQLDSRWWVTHAIIRYELTESIAYSKARFVEWAQGMMGPQDELLLTHQQIALLEKDHMDAILKRIELYGRYFNQITERTRRGMADKLINNSRNVARTINSLENYLALDSAEDPLLSCAMPNASEGEQAEWRRKASAIIVKHVRPAVQDYVDFLKTDLLPMARPDDKFGLMWMEGGEDLYSMFLPLHTGTPGVTAKEVHEIGLQEVASLVAQYEEIGPCVFEGVNQFPEIVTKLRTDPAMRYKSAEQMVEFCQKAVDKAFKDAKPAFGIYPDAPCKVVAVPPAAAEDAPPAFYMSPPFDGSRPGIYYINTHKPQEKDMFECDALAFHEAVPGHHLDRTIASELKDVPMLQRIGGTTAFVEGWGLYAETLANELGMYSNDVQQLGRLSSNIFRAARLVLDTGMHAFGWTREKAVDYFTNHVPITLVDIETETDRYTSWPGQACAYKMGERKIFALRKLAREKLGDKFKISEFHDEVLKDGGLTLEILEKKIHLWIERVNAA